MSEYQHGIEAAREVVLRLCREWLDKSRGLPEEDQLGYPPFHYMRAADEIAALGVDGGAVEPPETVEPSKSKSHNSVGEGSSALGITQEQENENEI